MTDLLGRMNALELRVEHGRRRSWTGVLAALFRLWDRRRQRRHLHELDDRLLRDVGLCRADVMRETAKPFWRA